VIFPFIYLKKTLEQAKHEKKNINSLHLASAGKRNQMSLLILFSSCMVNITRDKRQNWLARSRVLREVCVVLLKIKYFLYNLELREFRIAL